MCMICVSTWVHSRSNGCLQPAGTSCGKNRHEAKEVWRSSWWGCQATGQEVEEDPARQWTLRPQTLCQGAQQPAPMESDRSAATSAMWKRRLITAGEQVILTLLLPPLRGPTSPTRQRNHRRQEEEGSRWVSRSFNLYSQVSEQILRFAGSCSRTSRKDAPVYTFT